MTKYPNRKREHLLFDTLKEMSNRSTMIISNLGFGDTTFDSDVGSWNVSRAIRDCHDGKHELYLFRVEELMECSKNVEVEEEKIQAMVADPARLGRAPPPILCVENGKVWLIDGHHRIHAYHRLGVKEITAYVAEEEDNTAYRVYWNGERVSPFHKK